MEGCEGIVFQVVHLSVRHSFRCNFIRAMTTSNVPSLPLSQCHTPLLSISSDFDVRHSHVQDACHKLESISNNDYIYNLKHINYISMSHPVIFTFFLFLYIFLFYFIFIFLICLVHVFFCMKRVFML